MSSAIIHIGGSAPTSTFATDDTIVAQAPTKDSLASALSSSTNGKGEFLKSIEIHIQSSELATHYDPLALASLVSFLCPSGTLSIHVVSINSAESPDWSSITTSFLLAGLKSESEQRVGNGGRIFTARKAQKQSNSSSSAPTKLNLGKTKVKLSLDDDDDDQLIDEDDLLNEGAEGMLAPPPVIDVEARAKAAGDDCGGRKACDDCTCGRADREAAENGGGIREEKKESHGSSACGNCAKGDAFRCAGCPYLGKPAFKEGEEHLVLNLKDDV